MVSKIINIFLVLSILQMATPEPICQFNFCIVYTQEDLVTALSKESLLGIAIGKELSLNDTIEISKNIPIGLFNSITFSHQSDGFLISAEAQIITTAPGLELYPFLKDLSDMIQFSDEVTISGSDIAFNVSSGGNFKMNCTGNKVTIKDNRISFRLGDEGKLSIVGNIDFTSTENVIIANSTSINIIADGTIQSDIPIYIENVNDLILGGLKDKLSIKSTGEKSIAIDSLNAGLILSGQTEEKTNEEEAHPYGDIEIKGAINLNASYLTMNSFDRAITIENENGAGIISINSQITIYESKITIKGNPEAISINIEGAEKPQESPYISITNVNDIKFSSDSAATIYKFTDTRYNDGIEIRPYEASEEESSCYAANSMSFIVKDSQVRASPLITRSLYTCPGISQRQRSKLGSFDNVTIFDTKNKNGFVAVGSKGDFYNEKIKYIAINSGESFSQSLICQGGVCLASSQDDLECALFERNILNIAITKDLTVTGTVEISTDTSIGLFNSITFSEQSDGFLISASVDIGTTTPATELYPILKNYSTIIHFSDEVTISGSDIAFNVNGGKISMNCTGNKVTLKNNRIGFNIEDYVELSIVGNIDFTSTENVILANQSSVSIFADGTIQSALPIYIEEVNDLILGGLKNKLVIESTGEKSIAIDAKDADIFLYSIPKKTKNAQNEEEEEEEEEEKEEEKEKEVIPRPYGDIEIKGGINLYGSELIMSSYDKKISIENENGDGIISTDSFIYINTGEIIIKGNPEAINLKSIDIPEALKKSNYFEGSISIFSVNDIKFSSDLATTIYKFSENVNSTDERANGLEIIPYQSSYEDSNCSVENSMSFIVKDTQFRAVPIILNEDFSCEYFSRRQGSKIGSFDNVAIFDIQNKTEYVTVGSKGDFYDAEIKYIAINSGANFDDEEEKKENKTLGAVVAIVVIVCIIVVPLIVFLIIRKVKRKSAVEKIGDLAISFKE